MSGRKTQYASLPGGRIDQPQQHFHQGTFAGAIWSKQAKDLPLLNGEADLPASRILFVLFRQIIGINQQFVYLNDSAIAVKSALSLLWLCRV